MTTGIRKSLGLLVIWLTLSMVGAQKLPELGVPGPVLTPIQHLPYWRLEREQFGYNPRFQPGVTGFDAQNRPYIRAGKVIQTLDAQGRWVELDFTSSVRQAYPDWDGKFNTGPFADEHVVFDDQGDAYTLVNATRASIGRILLLHSRDGGRSWRHYPVGVGFARLERRDGHNDFRYPPPLLIYNGPEPGLLQLVLPAKKADGTLDVTKVIEVSRDSYLVSNHSGGGNSLCSQGELVHMVWPGRTSPAGQIGTPEYVATYDRRSGQLTPPVLLGYGGTDPDPNPHNLPAIAADSQGTLHVVLGAHHDPFKYTRSLQPRSVSGGWTEPVPFGAPKRTPSEGSYTYTGWLCGPDDTLHCVARWAGEGYYFRLAHLRKPKDGEWQVRPHLIIPFGGNYSVYYHKLNLDRRGRLWVNTVYTRAARFADEIAAHTRKHPLADPELDFINKEPSLFVSDDDGESWRLAVTADLQPQAPPVVAAAATPPSPVEEIKLPATLLRQIGGAFGPVALEGNLAAVGVGKSLVLLDVSNPAALRLAGQSEPLGDELVDVQIRLPYVYVAAWRAGFLIYDVSNPSQPRVVGRDTRTEARGFALVGDRVYLTAAGEGLRVLDISQPAQPRELGRLKGTEAYDVDVLDQTAYVATGSDGLLLADLTDPAAPKALGHAFKPAAPSDRVNTVWQLSREGRQLYVSPGPSPVSLRLFDLAQPRQPQELAQIAQPWGWGRVVAPSANRLYLAGLDGLHIVDVSNPAAPRELGKLAGGVRGVAVSGEKVVVSGGGALQILEVSDPAQPRGLSRYQTPQVPTSVAVSGSRLYLADWNVGVQAFDLTNPQLPRPLGVYAKPKGALGVAATGNHVLVAAGKEGLVILDASDGHELKPVATFASETGVRDVAVAGRFVYLAEGQTGVRIVDLANPAQPRFVGVFPTPRQVLGLEASGGRLYLAEAQQVQGGLRICEIGEQGTLRQIGVYDVADEVWDVTVKGDRAYLAMAASGLQVLDLSKPQTPRRVGRVDVAGAVWGVASAGKLHYLTLGRDGMVVIEEK